MIIEKLEFAQPFIKSLALEHASDSVAYAFFEMHEDADVEKYPALRDRTPEMVAAVKGIAAESTDKVYRVTIVTERGSELHEKYGFEVGGTQFASIYRIVFA